MIDATQTIVARKKKDLAALLESPNARMIGSAIRSGFYLGIMRK
jgi:hypothetical protein